MNTLELRQHLAAGGAVLFDLSARAKFTLTGADRVRYLNGQVSNDVRRLRSEAGAEALSACVMNAKGKMNGFVWISAGPECLRLDADTGGDLEEFREAFTARLERYIISDDVTLADTTGDFRLLHLLGVAPEALGPLPEGWEWRRARRYGARREGIDLLGPKEGQGSLPLPEPLRKIIREADAETEEVFRIEEGIPRWGAELNENTLPAEAGLDVSAIDFHKGCYIGQEVISRIKSVGRVNRRLCSFVTTSASAPLPQPGALLRDGEQEAGVITSAAWSFTLEKGVALGYLKRGIDASKLIAGSTEVEVLEGPVAPLLG